jgi:hypothetical protein
MTHAMIWTFGFLAFILLLTVAAIFWQPYGRDNGGQYRRLSEKTSESDEKTVHRLDQIGLQLGELRTQIAALERILKEVE